MFLMYKIGHFEIDTRVLGKGESVRFVFGLENITLYRFLNACHVGWPPNTAHAYKQDKHYT